MGSTAASGCYCGISSQLAGVARLKGQGTGWFRHAAVLRCRTAGQPGDREGWQRILPERELSQLAARGGNDAVGQASRLSQTSKKLRHEAFFQPPGLATVQWRHVDFEWRQARRLSYALTTAAARDGFVKIACEKCTRAYDACQSTWPKVIHRNNQTATPSTLRRSIQKAKICGRTCAVSPSQPRTDSFARGSGGRWRSRMRGVRENTIQWEVSNGFNRR